MDGATKKSPSPADDDGDAAAIAAFLRQEVPDWDDEELSRARFKALSGQRPDWEPLYNFWRNLILKIARHLSILTIRPSDVTRRWFRRAGLSPLCLDRVLLEMLRAGDLLPPPPQPPASSTANLFRIFRRALGFFGTSHGDDDDQSLVGDSYIVAPVLEERALEVVNLLSENYWMNYCVITMRKFRDVCGGSDEALTILCYLSGRGRARRLVINRADDPIEGVKVCFAQGAVCAASSVDYSVLHLVWTAEKLEKELDLIDQRYQKSRNSALTYLKQGKKQIALRHAKELKLISQSRERCTALLDRVENVLQIITDAESTKKVTEAIKSSTHAIRENQINIEEVELCLQDVDENIASLKQLDNALESNTAYSEIHDEDIEDEFNQLQLEIGSQDNQVFTNNGVDISSGGSEETVALTNALSNLNLKDGEAVDSVAEHHMKSVGNKSMSKERRLEAA